jgi:hypothetical protein
MLMLIVSKTNGQYKLEDLYKMPSKLVEQILEIIKEVNEAQEKALSRGNKITF